MSHHHSAAQLRTLLVGVVAVPLFLFFVIAWHDRKDAFEEAARDVDRSAALIAEHAKKLFGTYRYILDSVDERIAGMDWDAIGTSGEIHADLKRIVRQLGTVESVWLTDAEGLGRNSSSGFPMPDATEEAPDWLQALASEPGTHISRAYPARIGGTPTFTVATRRHSSDNRFDGAIAASVHVDLFEAFFADVTTRPGDIAALIRSDGSILAAHPTAVDKLAGAPIRLAPGATARGVWDSDGVERIIAQRGLDGWPVHVVYGRTVHSMQTDWLRDSIGYGLLAVGASALLGAMTMQAIRRARLERDLVGRLEAEVDRRRRAEELLQKVQRLEVLGQIAGGVAHDFNNLLMVITSNLYLAQGKVGGDGPAATFIDTAMQAAYRGGQLTQQLLTFARQQALKPEALDLGRLLDAMVEGMLTRSLRGDIAVETRLAPDLWPVAVDRTQLELALLNLAVNARDAMPEGGWLLIATVNRTFVGGPKAPVGPSDGRRLEGDFVALTVADTGCGIDPAIRSRVFDPFFTTKEVGKGTGLGLSQVWGFASQSGGAVAIDAVATGGTAVTIFLPRATEPAEPYGEPAATMVADGAGRCVLLVEDSDEIGRSTTTLLEGLGFRVVRAPNAERALAMLNAASPDSGGPFDVVFSDIVMPGDMNGVDLARAIRRAHPRMPVLLTTGYSSAARTAQEEGFRLLHKPYRPEALAAALRDVIRVAA